MPRYQMKRYKGPKPDKVYKYYVLALLAVIVAVWILVFVKVSEYEKGSTKYLLNKVTSDLEEEYGGDITYKRAKSVDEGILYNMYKDDELFATTVLVEREEKGMLGFSLYDIGEIKGVQTVRILALDSEDVTVGGKKLSELNVVEENIYLPALESLAEHKTNKTCSVPKYTLYESDADFTAASVDGNNIVLVKTDDGNLVAHEVGKKTQTEIKTWIENFIEGYTHYVVFGKGFDDIKEDIFYTSPIYNTVAKFKSMWDYYYDYEVTMHDINYSDFVQYTDNIVSVRVKYSFTRTYKNQVQDTRPDINFYLYKNNGKWQIIEMEISEWSE